MIKLFGLAHILVIISVVSILIVLFLIFKNKSLKTKRTLISVILWSNFALHFLKVFFAPYNTDFYSQFHKFTFENMCAVSTMVAPFIFFFIKKESPIHDYMYFILFMGGLLGILIPTEPTSASCTLFDLIRYFYCHGCLFISALLTFMLGIHKPKLKNVWVIVVGIFVYEAIIYYNELFLFENGFLGHYCWEIFHDSNSNNNAFTFGPTPDMEPIGKVLRAVTPNFLKAKRNGYISCYPVFWILFPAVIFFVPLNIVISLPFYFTKTKEKQ